MKEIETITIDELLSKLSQTGNPHWYKDNTTWHEEGLRCLGIMREHLALQKERSVRFEPDLERFSCAYRSDPIEVCGGQKVLMCAAGRLINDENYSPFLEGKSASAAPVIQAMRRSGVQTSEELISFLVRCQVVHDQCRIEDWNEGLDIVATRYGLIKPEALR